MANPQIPQFVRDAATEQAPLMSVDPMMSTPDDASIEEVIRRKYGVTLQAPTQAQQSLAPRSSSPPSSPSGIPDFVRRALVESSGVPQPSPMVAPLALEGVSHQSLDPDTQAALLTRFGNASPLAAPPPMPSRMASPEQPNLHASEVQPQQMAGTGNSNLGRLAADYARGSSARIPESVGKAAEQWAQNGQGPMPGRTPAETEANRQAYDAAQFDRNQTEDNAIIDRRLEQQKESDRLEAQARTEYLRGRGEADRQLQLQDEQQKRSQAIESRVAELDKLIEQRSQVQAGNPAEDYWSNMSTFGRIATSMALAAGAMGQALAGGQNTALELTNREIEGEIHKQRAMTETLGHQITGKRALMGDLVSQFRSPEAADSARRASLWGQVEAEGRRQANLEKSAAGKANLEAYADQAGMRRQDEKVKALQAEHQTLYTWRPAKVVGDAGGLAGLTKMAKDLKLSPEQEREVKLAYVEGGPQAAQQRMQQIGVGGGLPTTSQEIAARNFDLGRRVNLPGNLGGGTVWAPSEDGRKAAQTGLNSAGQILQNIDRLRRIVMSGTRLSGDDRVAVEQISAANTSEYKNAWELGVLSVDDRKLIEPLTGEAVNNFSLKDREKMLDNAESLTRQSVQKYLQTLYRDPNGQALYQTPIRTRKAQ